jgi:uncharacterized protein YndB with AHSA1/START domain
MNIVLVVLLVLGIIILFLLFLAAVTKGAYVIQRQIVIDKPVQEVFDYIKLVKNQEQYSHWVMQDPTNKITYTGVDGTIGFLGAWEGEQRAGKGEQEIVDLKNNESTRLEVRFEKPFKNTAYTTMTTVPLNLNQTQVNWEMEGRNKFPMTLFNLVIDSLLGKDMQKSLTNLKQILDTKSS